MKIFLQNLQLELDFLSSAVDPKVMRKSVTRGNWRQKKKQLIKILSFKVLTLL